MTLHTHHQYTTWWPAHGGRWSNRMYRVPALHCLLSTCVVFWTLPRHVVEYTSAKFLPESMYLSPDSSASMSYPGLLRHRCIRWFGKATGLHQLSSFLLSQYFFNWLKGGITKRPEVVLYLSLLSISPLSFLFCTLSSLMPGVDNSAEQLFCTANRELVSCLGRKNRASQLNPRHSDVYARQETFLGDCNHDVHKITHSAKSERFGLCGLSS